MELLLAAKNPELVQFYKKESEKYVKKNDKRNYTKLTFMNQIKVQSKWLFQNRKKKTPSIKKLSEISYFESIIEDKSDSPLINHHEGDEIDNIHLKQSLKPKNSYFGYSNDLVKYYKDDNKLFYFFIAF